MNKISKRIFSNKFEKQSYLSYTWLRQFVFPPDMTKAMFSEESTINIVLIFSAFAIVHSLTVTEKLKRLTASLFTDNFVRGAYRLIFTLFSILVTTLAFGLISKQPQGELISIPQWLFILSLIFQGIGFIVIIISFRHINLLEFTGIAQFISYIRKKELTGDLEGLNIDGLVKGGIYAYVRHPLYFGCILVFTFNPYPTINTIALSLAADIYFIIGGLIEEKRLIKIFGQEYLEYKESVPGFFPFTK